MGGREHRDDKLTITYGAGVSGRVTVPEVTDDSSHEFLVQTKTRGGEGSREDFSSIVDSDGVIGSSPVGADLIAAKNNLTIRVETLAGSGTVDVSPMAVLADAENERLVFTYTAKGNIDSVRLTLPISPWPGFTIGAVVSNKGTLSAVTAGSRNIIVTELGLTKDSTVEITYSGIEVPETAQEWTFGFGSGGADSGTGDVDGGAKVAVVSADGSGQVHNASETGAQVGPSGENPTIQFVADDGTAAPRAGQIGNLVFYYNLATSEYIRGGELRINVPPRWRTGLNNDNVEVKQYKSTTDETDENQVAEADRPGVQVAGSDIVVTIKKQGPGEPIRIRYNKAMAPAIRDESAFEVRSKSRERGNRAQIRRNRFDTTHPDTGIGTETAQVIVDVRDGKSGDSGSATLISRPSVVSAGSNDNTFVITYTAAAELSTRESNGGLDDEITRPTSESAFSSNGIAGIQLQIPSDWSRPVNDEPTDDEPNPDTAYITVRSSPRTGVLYNVDPLIIGNYNILVPIKQILPNQRIILTYGAETNQVEAPGSAGEVVFTILSKGGENGDTFTEFPKDKGPPSEGLFKFNVAAGWFWIGKRSRGKWWMQVGQVEMSMRSMGATRALKLTLSTRPRVRLRMAQFVLRSLKVG